MASESSASEEQIDHNLIIQIIQQKVQQHKLMTL